jgi:hypothetical protein
VTRTIRATVPGPDPDGCPDPPAGCRDIPAAGAIKNVARVPAGTRCGTEPIMRSMVQERLVAGDGIG